MVDRGLDFLDADVFFRCSRDNICAAPDSSITSIACPAACVVNVARRQLYRASIASLVYLTAGGSLEIWFQAFEDRNCVSTVGS